MPEEKAEGLSAEARETVELFASAVGRDIKQMQLDVNASLERLADKVESQINGVRTEIKEDLADLKEDVSEIKNEQRDQGKQIAKQSEAMVEVKTRLHEGDRRFDKIEDEQRRLAEKQEAQEKEQNSSKAFAAGAGAAAGGAVAYAFREFFGGG